MLCSYYNLDNNIGIGFLFQSIVRIFTCNYTSNYRILYYRWRPVPICDHFSASSVRYDPNTVVQVKKTEWKLVIHTKVDELFFLPSLPEPSVFD